MKNFLHIVIVRRLLLSMALSWIIGLSLFLIAVNMETPPSWLPGLAFALIGLGHLAGLTAIVGVMNRYMPPPWQIDAWFHPIRGLQESFDQMRQDLAEHRDQRNKPNT